MLKAIMEFERGAAAAEGYASMEMHDSSDMPEFAEGLLKLAEIATEAKEAEEWDHFMAAQRELTEAIAAARTDPRFAADAVNNWLESLRGENLRNVQIGYTFFYDPY